MRKLTVAFLIAAAVLLAATAPAWRQISSSKGDLPEPDKAVEPTASLVLDVDKNGTDDFVVAGRRNGPAIQLFRRESGKWNRYIVEPAHVQIEAGGAVLDVDSDGDLDLIFGGDNQSNEIWWWENPAPKFDPAAPWVRRTIKASGGRKHHDQMTGDFDGDGKPELISWNQGDKSLLMLKVPANPRDAAPWPSAAIYKWADKEEHEGLAAGDIDGDKKLDIVGGGRWFKHTGGGNFEVHIVDEGYRFSRSLAGDFIKGGRPEIVLGPGDNVKKLRLYEWKNNEWHGRDILPFDVNHGHTLRSGDVNKDGKLDIFVAEMGQWTRNVDNAGARGWVLYGDGKGGFKETVLYSGQGNHEGRLGDFDGDGDLDVLVKPFRHNVPRIDLWLNPLGKGK